MYFCIILATGHAAQEFSTKNSFLSIMELNRDLISYTFSPKYHIHMTLCKFNPYLQVEYSTSLWTVLNVCLVGVTCATG